jgi:hypothetical protein
MTSYELAESIMCEPIRFDDADELTISAEDQAALRIAKILGISVEEE